MKTESPARKQSDLLGFGQTSNISRDAVAVISTATMTPKPRQSSQP